MPIMIMNSAMKTDRKLVNDEFEVSRYDFEGTADEVKACLDLVVEKATAKGMVEVGRFNFISHIDGNLDVYYRFKRYETDREKETREKIEAKIKAEATEKRKKKKDAEYAEYERLKAKFEGK